jgi:tRNA (cmo5U34)-methyltransferase
VRKSTVDEIRARFDADVERFSNLELGQSATIDSPLAMGLVTEVAAAVCPSPEEILDLGCGAGNYTLALLLRLETPPQRIRLVDLSRPMLERTEARIRGAGYEGELDLVQGDLREIDFGRPNLVLAASVLHHLRTPEEWDGTFSRLFHALPAGGGLFVFDLVAFENPSVTAAMKARYGRYLSDLRDEAYRDHVFAYVEAEDTPIPVTEQI